ncbi:MAG TPA: hypothetical protein VGQ69_04445 [Gemmatimonadales bacterium]|jgi:hypothetical protein|nr:hypothetical protein [Gemmatimonadales bacterium]
MRLARRFWLWLFALASAGGCAREGAQQARTSDSTPAPRDTTPPLPPPRFRADTTLAWRRLTADSAIRLAVSSLISGRRKTDTISFVSAIRKGLRHPGWPVASPAPLPGALLPGRRIVAFYGNPLSTRMGILGEVPPEEMFARLDEVVAEWQAADRSTPVQPALHLITVVAQEKPGPDSLYRLRMDTTLIRKVYGWAQQKRAILILDIQAGRSAVQSELPRLLPWLARPDVHLAIDPEFYMHYNREGKRPGKLIGALDAADVNYLIAELGKLVTQYRLPPKVLVIHRFTKNMLQNTARIRLDPRVQVVINMDGWGQPWYKFDSYAVSAVAEPVQFTGFKLFFHHDTRDGDELLSPRELLALRPRPVYIQYQ